MDTRGGLFSKLMRAVRIDKDRNRLNVFRNRTPLLATVAPNVIHVIGRRNRRRCVCISNNVIRIRPNSTAILTSAKVHNRSLSTTGTRRTGHGTRRGVGGRRNSVGFTRTTDSLTGTVTRLQIVRLAGHSHWSDAVEGGTACLNHLFFFEHRCSCLSLALWVVF